MRIDRLISIRMMPHLPSISPPSPENRIPILMYHSISETSDASVSPYYQTCTTPEAFQSHMTWLKNEGYEVLDLHTGMYLIHEPEPIYSKRVILTFDDGFQDFYTTAFPILKKFGFGATVFLPTAYIGNTAKIFKGRPCMTWAEIRSLSRSGIEFGSHSHSHPVLHKLNFSQIKSELEISKYTLESQLGTTVSFSYPYAFPSADLNFTTTLASLLQAAGYQYGVTTRIGRTRATDEPLTLKRLPINSDDDNALFQAKLAGHYDWMAFPQRVAKAWKFHTTTYQQPG